jgi:Asp-tRNA(Asn)/Glu-tRNA(Gln) amidotransferase A subunit family amidase
MRDSATERINATLRRLKQTEPMVHAYVSTFQQQAVSEAKQRDGETSLGPLHGLPFAVKQVFDVAGVETTGGCQAFAGRIPLRDATVVERLRTAGAILTGTLVSHELTCGLDEPPTRNPWNLECYPGGSSAGAGVSVAVGSAAFALGTDAAGSVRIPAAMVGVVGLKPTRGIASQHGIMREASAPSIDNVGIIARNATMVLQVLKVIAGADPGDAQTLNHPVPGYRPDGALQWHGRRVAILGERTVAALDAICECEADVVAAFERACGQFADAGAELVAIELPSLIDAVPAVLTLFSTELASAHRTWKIACDSGYHRDVVDMLVSAMNSPVARIDEAVNVRVRLGHEVDKALSAAGVDILITPTTPSTAMPLATFRPVTDLVTLIPYTCGFNLTGHPAVSLPAGMAGNGLPVAVQIVGRRYADDVILQAGKAFESWNPQVPFDSLERLHRT